MMKKMKSLFRFILFRSNVGKLLMLIAILVVINYILRLRRSGSGLAYDSLFNGTEGQTCVHPVLDPFSDVMKKFYRKVPPIDCSEQLDWMKVSPDGAEFSMSPEAEDAYGPVNCTWQDVFRDGDFKVTLGEAVDGAKYTLKESDFVYVKCTGKGDTEWDNVMAGLRPDIIESEIGSPPGQALNILILGIDSLSRHTVARSLPRLSSWLESAGAVSLHNYNVMGDGTVAALAPLTTGLLEWELPESRRRIKDAQFVDVFPFIWKDYKKMGYVTSFSEDCPTIGTWTYRLKGFNEQPTDHFLRPFFMAADEYPSRSMLSYIRQQQTGDCFRGTPQYMVNYNHVRRLYKKYNEKLKFSLDWMTCVSHGDVNTVQVVDNDIVDLLNELESKGALNNTLVIFMSDHGHRFTSVRNTLQGKLEERMPMMSLRFPPWFRTSFPKAFKNLEINSGRLTTALDVHATFKHLLFLEKDVGINHLEIDGINTKAISLLHEIPESRDCSSAGIETHWCGCLNWAATPTNSELATEAANHLLNHINSLTDNVRTLCKPFSLEKITKAAIMAPKKDVLKFKKSLGEDAEDVDLGESSDVTEMWVQVEVVFEPGQAVFDATLMYDVLQKRFVIEGSSSISRISMYKGQAECMEDGGMRPWCFCRDIPQ